MPLSDYILENTLNEGSFGHVSKAVHKTSGKIFAVKTILKIHLVGTHANIATNEIDIHSKLPPHDHICKFIEFFETDDAFHLVLEECGGDLFDKYFISHNNLPCIVTIQKMFKELCLAIAHCHKNGIVHRDIKPENVVKKNGVCKLIDFGWAKYANSKDELGRVGTTQFLAPEKEQEYPVDIWSAGMLLYELVYGYLPKERYSDIEMKYLGSEYVSVIDLMKRMLVLDPSQRYTIKDVLEHKFLKDWDR